MLGVCFCVRSELYEWGIALQRPPIQNEANPGAKAILTICSIKLRKLPLTPWHPDPVVTKVSWSSLMC